MQEVKATSQKVSGVDAPTVLIHCQFGVKVFAETFLAAVVSCSEALRHQTEENPSSIIPLELCEDVINSLFSDGNLVFEDFQESREKSVWRTQVYQCTDLFLPSQWNAKKASCELVKAPCNKQSTSLLWIIFAES